LWISKKYISNNKTNNTISRSSTIDTKKIKELNTQLALIKSMIYSKVGASASSSIGAGCESFSNMIITIVKAKNSGIPKSRIPLLISDLDVFQLQRIAPKSSFATDSLADIKENFVNSFSDFGSGEFKEFSNISGEEGSKLLKGMTELMCFSGIMSGEW